MQVVLRPGMEKRRFTVGATYSVLAIQAPFLRLVDDEGGASLWARRHVSVTDPRVSPDWELSAIATRGRHILLSARSVRETGYFERVSDRLPGSDRPIVESVALSAQERERFARWFSAEPWAPAMQAAALGIFGDAQEAGSALAQLCKDIKEQGFPRGSVQGKLPGKVFVPIGNGGVAGFRRWCDSITGASGTNLDGVGTWEEWERNRGRGPKSPPDGSINELGRYDPDRVDRATDAESEVWQHLDTRTMRVRLKPDRRVHDLTPGRVYTVLEVIGVNFRVVSDAAGPKLFRFDAFVLVDPIVAPEWQVLFGPRGMRLTSSAFATQGYFERVSAREPQSELGVLAFSGLLPEERARFLLWFRGERQGAP
ncbi:MAG: hypothetical protein V4850_16440 [Myxococcota bacterium]